MLLAYTILAFSINKIIMILLYLINFLQNISQTLCQTTQGTGGMPPYTAH
jgi:hypothetical protein